MNTDWFSTWSATRYFVHLWPINDTLCHLQHAQWWQPIVDDLYWCRVCYYHRQIVTAA